MVIKVVLETAPSGRAKCKGCGKPIAKDYLRLGEQLPNPFGEGDMTLWFHPICAAHKRPEVLLEVEAAQAAVTAEMRNIAQVGIDHPRLPRIDGVERASSGRARCRHCRELIERDAWRVPLSIYREGMFNPMGFIHAQCAAEYFGTDALLPRLTHFASELGDREIESLRRALLRDE